MSDREQRAEDTDEERKKKRERARAWLARIRAKVQRVCGYVSDANDLISQAHEIASDLRELVGDPELHDLFPDARPHLEEAAERLEEVESYLERAGGYANIPAEVCDQVNEALDIADSLLQGRMPWQKTWDFVKRFVPKPLRTWPALVAGGVVAVGGVIAAIVAMGGGPTVGGVTILSAPSSMVVGEEAQLTAQVADPDGTIIDDQAAIVWSSRDEDIAIVSSTGTIVARSAGSTEVQATADGQSDTRTITVIAPREVASIVVEPDFVPLQVGQQEQLAAAAMDADGEMLDGVDFTWESIVPRVVDVDEDGLVTALAVGPGQVIATADGVIGIANVRVQPPPRPDLAVFLESRPDVECTTTTVAVICVTTVDVTVVNVGDGPAEATQLRVETQNGLAGSSDVPSLDPDQRTVVTVTTGGGGNCYAPNCTVTAIVDPAGQVDEVSEQNNTAQRTFGG